MSFPSSTPAITSHVTLDPFSHASSPFARLLGSPLDRSGSPLPDGALSTQLTLPTSNINSNSVPMGFIQKNATLFTPSPGLQWSAPGVAANTGWPVTWPVPSPHTAAAATSNPAPNTAIQTDANFDWSSPPSAGRITMPSQSQQVGPLAPSFPSISPPMTATPITSSTAQMTTHPPTQLPLHAPPTQQLPYSVSVGSLESPLSSSLDLSHRDPPRGVKRDRTSHSDGTPISISPVADQPNLIGEHDPDTPDSSHHKKPRTVPPRLVHPRSEPMATRSLPRRTVARHPSEPMVGIDKAHPSDTLTVTTVSPLLSSFSRLTHRRVRVESPTSPVPHIQEQPSSHRTRSTSNPSTRHRPAKTVEPDPPRRIAGCSPLPLPSDGVLTGGGNGLAAGVTIPKATPGKRGGGFSCHCCKTSKRNIEELFLCTNILPKNANSSTAVLAAKIATEAQLMRSYTPAAQATDEQTDSAITKKCNKKYCLSCMNRLYHRDLQHLRGPNADQWTCPSCLNRCSCAGCERRVAGYSETPWRRKKSDAKREGRAAATHTPTSTGRQKGAGSKKAGSRSRSRSTTAARKKATSKLTKEVPDEEINEVPDAHDHANEAGAVDDSDSYSGDDDHDDADDDDDAEDDDFASTGAVSDDVPPAVASSNVRLASRADELQPHVIPSPTASSGIEHFDVYPTTNIGRATNTFHLPVTPNTTTFEHTFPVSPHQMQHNNQYRQPRQHQLQAMELHTPPLQLAHTRSAPMPISHSSDPSFLIPQSGLSHMVPAPSSDWSHLDNHSGLLDSSNMPIDPELELRLLEKHRQLMQQQQITNMMLQRIQAQKQQQQHQQQHQHRQQQQVRMQQSQSPPTRQTPIMPQHPHPPATYVDHSPQPAPLNPAHELHQLQAQLDSLRRQQALIHHHQQQLAIQQASSSPVAMGSPTGRDNVNMTESNEYRPTQINVANEHALYAIHARQIKPQA